MEETTTGRAERSPLVLALVLVAALLATSALAACNTARGVGQDLGAAGEEIEDAVD
jgi:predicted small secreted protein